MKKLFATIGIIFSVLLVIGIGMLIYTAQVGSRLDADSKAYVDDIIPKIASHWNADELIEQSSPELMRVTSEDKIKKLCAMLDTMLGPMKEYRGSKGDSLTKVTNRGKSVTALYVAHASFEKKDATLRVNLILEDNKWKLLEFNVNPEL